MRKSCGEVAAICRVVKFETSIVGRVIVSFAIRIWTCPDRDGKEHSDGNDKNVNCLLITNK